MHTQPPAMPRPAPASGAGSSAQLSDISIAGDPLACPRREAVPERPPSTVAEFAGLARAVAADSRRWAPVVRYDPFSRWYHRLEAGPGYEVWLLTWLPGQGSGVHDHGRSSGVVTVLRGTLTERSLTGAGAAIRELVPGIQRVFAPGYLHEAVNNGVEPVVSLHVYFPGLTEMTRYPHLPHTCRAAVESEGT